MKFIRDARIAWSALAAGNDRSAAEAATRWMASRSLWLTPDAVAGFDPADCIFHTAAQQRGLGDQAEQFQATATELAGRRLTRRRLAEAAEQLGGLLGSLAEYFTRPEGQALVRALRAGPAPSFVLALDYELGTDWTGDPAIYAWVITKGRSRPRPAESDEFTGWFQRRAWQAVGIVGSDRIPYVRLRSEVEARAATAGGGL